MGEITSMIDFAAQLAGTADMVATSDPTTFTDVRVAGAAAELVATLERALWDGRCISAEQPVANPRR